MLGLEMICPTRKKANCFCPVFDLSPPMPYNGTMKRLLPIGIQDFVKIREGGYYCGVINTLQ